MKKYLFTALFLFTCSALAEDEITPVTTSIPVTTGYTTAREIVQAFYDELLTNTGDDDHLAEKAARIVGKNWDAVPDSLAGDGLKGLVGTFTAYHQAIPDIKWTPQEILKVSANRYVVRSVGTGTPVFDFLHIGAGFKPGNSFKIMTIDIHTLKNDKIVKTYHVEDWAEAIQQLSAAAQ